jgi:DNA-binding PadR family transcriptional regulator
VSLRYALLGFLTTTPLSGYQLARRFRTGGGLFWEAVPSQIYRELTNLERLGWIAPAAPAQPAVRNQRVYHVTDAGAAAMEAWCDQPQDYPPERDPERVRLLNMDRAGPGRIRAHLEAHRAHYDERRRFWQQRCEAVAAGTYERLNARLRLHPDEKHAFITGQVQRLFAGNLRRCDTEITWAEEFLAWLDVAAPEDDASAR